MRRRPQARGGAWRRAEGAALPCPRRDGASLSGLCLLAGMEPGERNLLCGSAGKEEGFKGAAGKPRQLPGHVRIPRIKRSHPSLPCLSQKAEPVEGNLRKGGPAPWPKWVWKSQAGGHGLGCRWRRPLHLLPVLWGQHPDARPHLTSAVGSSAAFPSSPFPLGQEGFIPVLKALCLCTGSLSRLLPKKDSPVDG